eukprot:COSAG06_NODE_417_length_15986_cov_832.025493_22_plen_107_part_00
MLSLCAFSIQNQLVHINEYIVCNIYLLLSSAAAEKLSFARLIGHGTFYIISFHYSKRRIVFRFLQESCSKKSIFSNSKKRRKKKQICKPVNSCASGMQGCAVDLIG